MITEDEYKQLGFIRTNPNNKEDKYFINNITNKICFSAKISFISSDSDECYTTLFYDNYTLVILKNEYNTVENLKILYKAVELGLVNKIED